jgi:hypothetical protein
LATHAHELNFAQRPVASAGKFTPNHHRSPPLPRSVEGEFFRSLDRPRGAVAQTTSSDVGKKIDEPVSTSLQYRSTL